MLPRLMVVVNPDQPGFFVAPTLSIWNECRE
jgi:hypothetical protein